MLMPSPRVVPRLARAAIGMLLAVLAGCAAPPPRLAAAYRVVGYVTTAANPSRIAAEKLTALNFAFAQIDESGEIALQRPEDVAYLSSLRVLKSRNPRLKVLVSVGGWGADGFSDAAATEDSRAAFARSAADLIERYALDGVDLDWEYPGLPGPGIHHRDQDARNFTLLLRALRERFDALGATRGGHCLLTVALADGEFVAHIELDRIGAYLDWINLMTYDFHNSLTKTTGHHAALSPSTSSAPGERSVESAVAQYLAAGVPARKVVVGVPFYGRAFADVQSRNNGLDQPYGRYAGDYAWPQLVGEFIDRNGFVRHWDDTARVPYLWNAKTRTFISYDDPQSLKLKAEFVKAHGLGGMMYWEQSQDPDGQLLGVLATALE
jgi:chitinase